MRDARAERKATFGITITRGSVAEMTPAVEESVSAAFAQIEARMVKLEQQVKKARREGAHSDLGGAREFRVPSLAITTPILESRLMRMAQVLLLVRGCTPPGVVARANGRLHRWIFG